MPRYDIDCPTCGIYERHTTMDGRRGPCEKCGSEITLLITLSGPTKGFDSYFDQGLGEVVGGLGDRNKLMRESKLDHRDVPSKGEISARRDASHERSKRRHLTRS